MLKNKMKVAAQFTLLSFLFLVVALNHLADAWADDIYFIDAHSQVDHTIVPLGRVISVMEKGGVRHAILSARGKLQGQALLEFARQYPDRITPAVRTKGNPYNSDSPRYYKMLEAQVTSGKFSAMAEVLLYHAQKGRKASEVEVYPDDRRVRAALAYAIQNQWPLVIHIEFASLNEDRKKRFWQAMQNMLDKHAAQPFVLTHMGQLEPDQCQSLIERHSNIYFHTAWSNPAAVRSSNQPWINLFEGHRFSPQWEELFIQHPDRFIFALDNVFEEHWGKFYIEQMKYWKKALAELPETAAHLIAHGNAERLWRISESN